MDKPSPWSINNGNLTLKKSDPGIEAFNQLFDAALKVLEIDVTGCEAMPSKAGQIAIRGKVDAWGGSEAGLTLIYEEGTDSVLSIGLSKAIVGELRALKLPSALDDKAGFKALQQALLFTAPRPGSSSEAIVSRQITGKLDIGDKTATFQIQEPHPGRPFFIETTFDKDLGFADLAHLFGHQDNPNQDLAELPHAIWQATDIVTLKDFTLQLDPRDSDLLTYLSVTLLFAEGKLWTIADVLAIGGLWVQINVDYPLGDARFPILKLGGEMDLAGGKLDISARWPDWAIHGELRRGTSIQVGQLLQHLGLIPSQQEAGEHSMAAGCAHLAIQQLSFTADPFDTPISFSFYLDIVDVWSITLSGQEKFEIEELSLILDYLESSAGRAGATQAHTDTYDLTFMGKLQIASARLFLVAQYLDAGWQFEGGTQPASELQLGEFLAEIAKKFGLSGFPDTISHLVIANLRASFNTVSKNFTFTCEGKFPIEGKEVDITVSVELAYQTDGSYKKDLSGQLQVGMRSFDLHLLETTSATIPGEATPPAPQTTTDILIASYSHPSGTDTLHLKTDLFIHLTDDVDLLARIPDIALDLKDVLFAYCKQAATSQFLFGLDIGVDVDLSNLPLVGKTFPPQLTVGVDDLQVILASKPFTQTTVTEINALLPAHVTRLPAQFSTDTAALAANSQNGSSSGSSTAGQTTPVLERGFNITAKLKLGTTIDTLAMLATVGQSSLPASSGTPGASSIAQPPSDGATWIAVQKTLGPVDVEKIGARYQAGKLWFLLSAAMSAAGLTISLDGLGVGSALKPFAPEFTLRGLGIDYRSESLEIGGAFLRQQVQAEPEPYDEYDGMVVIKTEELSLAALGAYSKYQGHDSLFIYAVLDYPLGGPSFFFVTGLAAGFGYNRDLKIPPIEQIAQFPLVAEALSPKQLKGGNTSVAAPGAAGDQATGAANIRSIADTLTAELEKLRQFVPPAPVDFLAVGLRFTSFKIVDSFALLTLAFGHRFELHVLGMSTLISPAPEEGQDVTPLAEAQLALKASFIPDEGFLGVQAQLTNSSYILSRACFLTGGFAFFAWYKDNPRQDPAGYQSGDFVLTIGGYHPRFVVPQYYPKVPRLGFNWRVDEQIGIKGDLYFALTGHAMMAGGHLDAVWESGDLKAWFKAGADFIVSWKPYYYDASMYVDIGASLTFDFFGTHHITIELGADMHLWGPEFSGKATLHYWVISCTIAFGADAQTPSPIDWAAFKSSFLPAEDAITSIAVKSGLVTKDEQDDTSLGAMNPKEFLLITNSLIPITETNVSADTAAVRKAFGVAPMAVTRDDISASKHTVSIRRDGQDATRDFQFAPITKNVPTGLWGESFAPDLNSQAMVADTWAGLEIRPMNPPIAGETAPIDRRQLQFETETLAGAYAWETPPAFVDDGGDEAYRRTVIQQTISDAATQARRDGLLQALGIPAARTPDADLAEALLFAPRLEAPQA